jgi:UDP-3-O-[3-hydroxymyristoyl] glucosamine N-acyltransferase
MQFTAAQIALLVQGRVEGDANKAVQSFGKIEEAVAGQLSFLANPKYEEFLYSTNASVIIINENLALKSPVNASLVRVPDAYTAFATLMTKYQELAAQELKGIQEPSYIAKNVSLGEGVFIGAFAYLGTNTSIGNNTKVHAGAYLGERVKVGNNSVIHAGVKIYQDCIIGDYVIIHAGTVVGSDGFGFAPQADGSYKKVPQLGNVVVEDYVEIGANTTIDRATMGSTFIRKGVKLDNLVQVAHNVDIGIDTVIAAQTGISGSTKIGQNVMIGGQVGVAGHITIADGTKVTGQSGVTKPVKLKNAVLSGTPALNIHDSRRSQVLAKNLPELEKRVKELEKLVNELLTQRVNE